MYYLGNGDINYYVEAENGDLQNASGKQKYKIKKEVAKKNKVKDNDYQNEWAIYSDMNKTEMKKINKKSVKIKERKVKNNQFVTEKVKNSNPPTSGNEITDPYMYENDWII